MAARLLSRIHDLGWSEASIRRGLFGIATAAILVKALLLFVVLPALQQASPTTYQADRFPDWYDQLALSIAEGRGYRFSADTAETMLRTPGWPLVLAGLFSFVGYGLVPVQIFNVLCSIGTAGLTFRLAARISGHRLLGLVAALLVFLHPAILIADSRGGVESFFTLLLTLFLTLLYRVLKTDSLKEWLLAGGVLGGILLVKSTAALLVPCAFVCHVLQKPSRAGTARAFVATAALSLGAAVVLSPWIARNYRLSGEFVPTMTVSSMVSWMGVYLTTNRHTGREQHELDLEASDKMGGLAKSMSIPHRSGYYPLFYSVSDEVRFYRLLGQMVLERYREDPGLILRVAGDNAVGFWVRGRTMKATTLNAVLVLPVLALSLLGAVSGLRRGLHLAPLLLFALAFYLAHVPLQGQARYHVPLIPILSILVSLAFAPLAARLASRPVSP
jgi:4-amino-4-deoxy-L-arabinose transferase-like glycosyltransferase